MHDLLNQIATTLRGMWKYRRMGVLIAWIVAAIGAAGVLMIPDRYEASSRVYVDTQSILRPLMAGLAIQPDVEQQVAMLSRTLINRPTVEKLMQMAQLETPGQTKAERDALVANLSKSLAIRSTGRDNLYTLSYRDENPERSLEVVKSLLTIFVESAKGASGADSDSARRFIEEQIKNYEQKLSEAEARVKEFRLRNLDMQAAGGPDVAARMAEMLTTLSQARLELREAESAREAARVQLEKAREMARSAPDSAFSSIATPELDSRLDALKRSLDALLQRFTDQHPDVLNTRKLIKELEDQKRRDIADMRRAAAASPSAPVIGNNPAIVEMSRTLASAEVQVASLRARVGEYEARAARLREQMKVAPQMEAELAQLNRDYEIHRKNYQDLVSRRETVLMSGELESTSNLADFRVVEPPQVSRKPVAPNRALLLPVALIAALAAGVGVTFLVSQLRPVFFDASALRGATELPLLGVVTLVKNDTMRRRESRSLRRFLMAILALVVLFLIGMAALSYHSSL
ncbi:XrtA system polysaccharide chain length determinant [Hydrogenophaga sp. 2FB]|uniref:XrtA system polysaccharide chain length determinant n=1 Tax=Hydrogenophaga sp. 2FB TaxID=2502187 RepID=UPI0010F65DB5|nr:XrtA system polysaccharide chain length determinant [Hydrogenophaga sp. 2FB]